MIVEDGAAIEAGQMARTTFLSQLHGQVIAATDDALGPIGAAVGCPYIEAWFARNSGTPAAQLEALARRYSGLTVVHAATEYIPPILERLRAGVTRWRSGGDVSAEIAAAGLAAPAPGPSAGPPAAVQRKSDGSEPAEAGSPVALLDELGPGHAFADARLGPAMGDDFGDVRIHTDAVAARKASDLGARAFTVGSHVAFAAGEYQPGTLGGDALLAHELAHVQQQRGAGLDDVARKRAEAEGPEGEHEQDADQAAVGAIARLWGGGKSVARRAASALKSSVSLKRCGTGTSSGAPSDGGVVAGVPMPPAIATTHGADSHGGAALPDATQQAWLAAQLNPESVVTPAPPTSGTPAPPSTAPPVVQQWDGLASNPAHVANQAALKTAMKHQIRLYLDGQMTTLNARATGPRVPMTQAGTGALAGHDTGVQGIAGAANDAVSTTFGGDTGGAALSSGERSSSTTALSATGLQASRTLFDQSDLGDLRYGMNMNDDGLAWDAANWIGTSTPTCMGLLSTHHLSTEGSTEETTYWQALVDEFLGEGTNRADALMFQQYGLDTTTDRGVLLTTVVDTAGYPDADSAERARRWGLFVEAIHETMHRRAHPTFAHAETGQVMREGFCEMFSEVAGNAILTTLRAGGNELMRKTVEGGDHPILVSVIPDHYTIGAEYQDFYNHAIAIRGRIGDASVRAAYFQGHIELLGLTPAGAAATSPPAGTTTLPIPNGIHDVDQLATATGIARAQLVADNPGIATTFPTAAVLPGCRIHVVVASGGGAIEDRATIAAQNGVSEADLVRANPGIVLDGATNAWPTLTAGDRILIPVH